MLLLDDVLFSVSSFTPYGDDEPKTLPYAITLNCPTGADAGHSTHHSARFRFEHTNHTGCPHQPRFNMSPSGYKRTLLRTRTTSALSPQTDIRVMTSAKGRRAGRQAPIR